MVQNRVVVRMKRDMDLIRTILLAVEEQADADNRELRIDDAPTDEVLAYHYLLLDDAGLIEARHMGTVGYYRLLEPKRLTWAGHEFLDAARNEALWEQAKRMVFEKTGGQAMEVLKAVLVSLAKKALEL